MWDVLGGSNPVTEGVGMHRMAGITRFACTVTAGTARMMRA